MNLLIDTRNGISGNIFNAGLIGLGVNQENMISSMEYAGALIGKAEVVPVINGKTVKLKTKLETEHYHISESEIKEFLEQSIKKLDMAKFYQEIAKKSLEIICNAERYVHSHHDKLQHMINHHGLKNANEAFLHEAKDILIDVVGLSMGLQELNIDKIMYLDYVNVGSGEIKFSHGEFKVPAPATEYILNKYNIKWRKSRIYGEMATPTGVSILAGSSSKRIGSQGEYRVIKTSLAQGTRGLPSVSFHLIEEERR
jgi:uncharacterized protein (DUF111 family)